MTGNRLLQLTRLGQRIWYDYIRRDLYEGPTLRRLIEEDALTGMTSNPAIFERAITQTSLYDPEIYQLAARRRKPAEIFEAVALHDVRRAADSFRSVFEDRKSTRLNSSHEWISYAVFCLKKKI